MALSRRTFTLLLATTPGIGGKSTTKVIARNELLNRTPEEFLALSPEAMREEYRLTEPAASTLVTDLESRIKRTFEMEKSLSELGVIWVTAADAHYPSLVEEMDPNPPEILYLYGNTRLLDGKTFCVLSSRNTMPADLNLIEQLAEKGILEAEILVTGHDRPEYQRSAVVPLRWGSPRILCLDRGFFDVLGPDLKREAFRTARLWRYEFDPTTDLVVSAFPPAASFKGINNQVRDRLVGSLSRRIDLVEVSPNGNMDRIARMALKCGRKVRVSDRCPYWRQYAALGAESIST
jgi:DNA processing protein